MTTESGAAVPGWKTRSPLVTVVALTKGASGRTPSKLGPSRNSMFPVGTAAQAELLEAAETVSVTDPLAAVAGGNNRAGNQVQRCDGRGGRPQKRIARVTQRDSRRPY
jgi:hypothetical protein